MARRPIALDHRPVALFEIADRFRIDIGDDGTDGAGGGGVDESLVRGVMQMLGVVFVFGLAYFTAITAAYPAGTFAGAIDAYRVKVTGDGMSASLELIALGGAYHGPTRSFTGPGEAPSPKISRVTPWRMSPWERPSCSSETLAQLSMLMKPGATARPRASISVLPRPGIR